MTSISMRRSERLALTEAIGALQFEAAWPTLRSLALGLDEPLLVRLAAVSALARMDRARGELVLLQAARSGRPQVRGAALAELGAERFAGGAARAALEQALSDPSETVRLVAVEGLAIIGDHRSASALRGCLSASSAVLDEVGARVIRALRCLRDFASAAEIIGLAVKAREPLFVECLRFVRELPSDRAIRALLENSDPAFGARRWQLLELLIPSQIAERPVEQDIEAWRRWWETRDGAPLYRDGRPQWR